MIAQEAQSVYEEARGGIAQLVRMDLHVSQAAGVVHAHMQEIPAGSLAALVSVAGDPMPQTLESAEFFGIDVDQLTGVFSFIAHHRWRWV